MLHSEHSKNSRELKRRIGKLREDGVDPTLPQKQASPRPSVPPHLAPTPSASPPLHASRGRLADSQHTVDESFMLLGQQVRVYRLDERLNGHSPARRECHQFPSPHHAMHEVTTVGA